MLLADQMQNSKPAADALLEGPIIRPNVPGNKNL
jgi:hypothetical protein